MGATTWGEATWDVPIRVGYLCYEPGLYKQWIVWVADRNPVVSGPLGDSGSWLKIDQDPLLMKKYVPAAVHGALMLLPKE